MKRFTISFHDPIIIDTDLKGVEALQYVNQQLKQMDLFDKLRIINEVSFNCTECKTSIDAGKDKCDSCFNIWMNRRSSPQNYNYIRMWNMPKCGNAPQIKVN